MTILASRLFPLFGLLVCFVIGVYLVKYIIHRLVDHK